jgi:HAD superfamily hydrolase (TIGR01509 family)
MHTDVTRALILDFDGVVLDTETAAYQSWQEIFTSYGCSLTVAKWTESVCSPAPFDPCDHLEEQLGRRVDRGAVRDEQSGQFAALMTQQHVLPGVRDYLREAEALGLRTGIASNSPRRWVFSQLQRVGLASRFDVIKCAEDVEALKPAPDLYQAVLRVLGTAPYGAIAVEDSPNGVKAAKKAGLFCVAVPSPMTSCLRFDQADLKLPSLDTMPLVRLLACADSAMSP